MPITFSFCLAQYAYQTLKLLGKTGKLSGAEAAIDRFRFEAGISGAS